MRPQLSKAVAYLSKLSPNEIAAAGEYLDAECTDLWRECRVMFPAAFVLHALAPLQSSKLLKPALQKNLTSQVSALQKFLQRQQAEFSWNYWLRGSKESKTLTLPDDVDDTAAAASALLKSGADIPMEIFLKTMQLEEKPGGPYTTWYLQKKLRKQAAHWFDTDPIVNAHFAYLAATYGLNLPSLHDYLLKSARSKKMSSPYYPTDLFFLLYAARYLRAAPEPKLQAEISSRLAEIKFNSLAPRNQLMHALTRATLGLPISSLELKAIAKFQETDGGMPLWATCYGFEAEGGKASYVGNRPFHTALFVELITLTQPEEKTISPLAKQVAEWMQEIEVQVGAHASAGALSELLKLSAPPRGLSLLATVSFSFRNKLTNKMQADLNKLATAMWWGWCGYTILDDLIDGDRKVDAAALCIDCIQACLNQLHGLESSQIKPIQAALIALPGVYRQELSTLRLGKKLPSKLNYGYVSERMQAFISTCETVPGLLGVRQTPKQRVALQTLITSMLIVRQLNDDAHDWEQDLAKGILTYPLWLVLRNSKNRRRENLRKVFGVKVLPQLLDEWGRELDRGAAALKVLGSPAPLAAALAQHRELVNTSQRELADLQKLSDFL